MLMYSIRSELVLSVNDWEYLLPGGTFCRGASVVEDALLSLKEDDQPV